MRIGMICYPSYGGSGVVATELGKKLASRGHEIHFVTYERPFRLDVFDENIFYHEVEVVDYPLFKFPPYTIALASKIAEVSKWANLDLVHVHYAIPHTVSAFLARQMVRDKYLPIMTTLHGTDITIVGHEPQFFDITKFSIEESDMITAVSRSLREDTVRTFGIDKEIEVVYNFIDPQEYRRVDVSSLKKRFFCPQEKVIIHISNFRPVKRVKDVVDVFARIRQKMPACLLLVGDGPEVPAIHQYVESQGLTGSVRFLGKQDRVVELLSVSDLCLLPSEKESFGLAALEAMACGVPVIASATGGLPEVITNGFNGYLLPVGDVQAMAEKAVQLLIKPEAWQQMSVNGVSSAGEKFHIDEIVQQYEACYRRLIERET